MRVTILKTAVYGYFKDKYKLTIKIMSIYLHNFTKGDIYVQ